MFPYALIDLHCDTLTTRVRSLSDAPDSLDNPESVLSLSAIPPEVHWAQFYAIFIPDRFRGPEAIAYYEKNRLDFSRQMRKFKDRVAPCVTPADMEKAWSDRKTAAFLTVENGSALAGDLSRVALLRRHGVRCMTLVWNGDNELGSGHTTQKSLSPFGREAVAEMEKEGILADVSHLNDPGFEDFFAVAKKPFVATHSNARAVCGHKRNLTDDMIREMVRRNCLIGLNYYVRFLEDDGNVSGPEQLLRHVEHFFALGAEKNLALGSDFDGADLPDCLSTPRKAAALYGFFLEHGLSEEQASGILYKNAQRFFRENL